MTSINIFILKVRRSHHVLIMLPTCPSQSAAQPREGATAGPGSGVPTIGHGLSNILFGFPGETQAPPQQAQTRIQQAVISCDAHAKAITSACQISIHLTHFFSLKDFTKCLGTRSADTSIGF